MEGQVWGKEFVNEVWSRGKWEKGGEMGMGHKEQRMKNTVWLNVEQWGECGGRYITYGNQSGQNNVWSLTTASETQSGGQRG